ncbi:ImmA/IrrE family metallo-endopeptidase [Fictibacillus sp. 5RED26]|uniref:ArdC-like ssDNA-binding domain-containing protein n=1 Tax=Fictibacillus sp. 5RED26 TaxID=2745876 RepID=UPI0018CDF133|nr:ArdC-like ssDNA-binding domain-containing protein [Fictibacillus sp. 5RED26]MBH0158714.1 ImmA/IrrE family metallo-endopeptidase [Fictibacillus sp. 5RED26]
MAKIKDKEERQKELSEIVNTMNDRIEEVTQSPEDLKEYLRFMSNFYTYSISNTLLIQHQFMGASAVASFTDFKKKGFFVNKGEKGIGILVPFELPKMFRALNGEKKKVSEATPEEKKLLKNGTLEVLKQRSIGFKKGYVFDISQTNATAEDLTKIFPNRWLEGDVKDYDLLDQGINAYMEKIGVQLRENESYSLGVAKGAYFPGTHEIILNPRNGQLQNIKTKIHELAHATLHRDSKLSQPEKEFQAELVAVSVASYFGLDTTEYSLPYLHEWTKGAKLENKKDLLQGVHKTVKDMVSTIEETRNKQLEREVSKENEPVLEQTAPLSFTIPIPHKAKKPSISKEFEKTLLP